MIAFTVVLLLASVPVLAIVGGSPQTQTYTAQGVTASPIPATPAGWQVNSSTPENLEYDTFSVTNVYVPQYHPEDSNYTVYYELAVGLPISAIPNGDIPGWERLSNNFTVLGPFQGYLSTYHGPHGIMLIYSGTAKLVLLQGTTFGKYVEEVGFVRHFTSLNVSADDSQFMGDLNSIWLPAFTSASSHSTWTLFLADLDAGVVSAGPYLLMLFSIPVMSWMVSRARNSDRELDRFLTRASTLGEGHWVTLSALMKRQGRAATGQDLVSATVGGGETGAISIVVSSLRFLEDLRMVRRVVVERGAELIEMWKASV